MHSVFLNISQKNHRQAARKNSLFHTKASFSHTTELEKIFVSLVILTALSFTAFELPWVRCVGLYRLHNGLDADSRTVVMLTQRDVLLDENIDRLADAIVGLQKRENTTTKERIVFLSANSKMAT